MYANGGRTGAALTRIHVENSRKLDPRDLVAAVVQSGDARVRPVCTHDDRWWQLVLLRLLIVSMSQGCACVGGGIERSKGSLRRCTRERTSGAGVEWLHQQKQHGVEEESAWQHLEEGWGWAVGRGGRALRRLQRSETSANENCVAASANAAGIAFTCSEWRLRAGHGA